MTTMDKKTATAIAKNADASQAQLESVAGIDAGVDRLLARHPKAGASLLEELSHSRDKSIRKNVVLNANTPKETLIRLAPQFPGDFFMNPAFDWLILEDPNLLFSIGQGVLKNILKRPECPESFMNWAVEHGSEQEKLAVAMNPKAPKNALETLVAFGGRAGSAASGHATIQMVSKEVDLEHVFISEFKNELHQLMPSEAADLFRLNLIDLPQFPYLNAVSKIYICGYNPDSLARSGVSLDATEIFHTLVECARYDSGYSDLLEALPLALPALKTQTEFNDGLKRFLEYVLEQEPSAELPTGKQPIRLAIPLLSCLDYEYPIPDVLFSRLDQFNEYDYAIPAFLHPSCPQKIKDKYAAEISDASDRFSNLNTTENAVGIEQKIDGLMIDLDTKIVSPYRAVMLERKNGNNELTLENEIALQEIATEIIEFCEECTKFKYDPLYYGVSASLLEGSYKQIYSACEELLGDGESDFAPDWVNELIPILEDLVSAPSRSARMISHAISLKDGIFRSVARAAKSPVVRDSIPLLVCSPESSVWYQKRLKLSYDKSALVPAVHKGDIFFIRDRRAAKACNSRLLAARVLGLVRNDAMPEVLAKRSKSIEWLERMAVASNPNTPSNVIESMRNDSHSSVARQAESTFVKKQLDFSRQKKLLAKPLRNIDLTPLAFEVGCRFMEKYELPEKWTLYFDSISIEELGNIDESRKNALKRTIASSASAPEESLAKLVKDPDKYVRISLAKNPHTPKHLLDLLALDDEAHVRNRIAENPASPNSLLDSLAKTGNWLTKILVLNNPSTAEALKSMLASELLESEDWKQNPGVRIRVAENPSTSTNLLEKLAQDIDRGVREAVAKNPSTPSKALGMLAAENFYFWTMGTLLSNPHMPEDIAEARLNELAKGSDRNLRAVTASCPRTPISTLVELSKDEDHTVKRAVAANPACPSSLLEEIFVCPSVFFKEYVFRGIASNKNTPLRILQDLSLHRDKEIRIAVAGNASVTAEIVERLSKDKEMRIRLAVISNMETPQYILERLKLDQNGEVRQACRVAMKERGLPMDVYPTSDVPGFQENDFIVPFEIMFPDLSIKGLSKLAYSKDWVERSAAAIFPETPSYLLYKFLEDENDHVKYFAAKRLKELETA